MFRHFWIWVALLLVGSPAQADVWWLDGARPQAAVPAAIIGPTDNREWLTPENGEKLGLSAAEVTRIQNSTGFVSCKGAAGSAALVIDNRHIITAIHVIVDKDDPKKKFRENCTFYPHDARKRYVPHPLVLTENSYIAGTLNVERNKGGDWAVIKLARPVARGVPFAIGDERVWRIGSPIVVISSVQSDKPEPGHKDNPGLPLAQKCVIRNLVNTMGGRIFLSDCDLKKGGSGGVSVMRLDGNLVLAGIMVGSAESKDFQPYGPKNFTASVSVTNDVVNAVFRLGAGNIRTSAHQKHALLAGDIGDDLDEMSRLIALRTETQALNNFNSTVAVRWKSNNASGYVLPLGHDGPPLAKDRCRSFVHAVVYAPDRIKSAKGKVCRDKNGPWSLAKTDLQSEAPPPQGAAGAPPNANAGPERREMPSSPSR